VAWYIWPFKARNALRKTLSSTLLDINTYYASLCTASTASSLSTSSTHFDTIERRIYKSLCEMDAFVLQTKSEPRLRGPFPFTLYVSIIKQCWHVFDALIVLESIILNARQDDLVVSVHDMSPRMEENELSVMSHPDKSNDDLAQDVLREVLVGNVTLIFHTLSSAACLKTRVPRFLPDCIKMRDEMIKVSKDHAIMDICLMYSIGADAILLYVSL
jgi:Aromatic acid exporter family member 2